MSIVKKSIFPHNPSHCKICLVIYDRARYFVRLWWSALVPSRR